MMTNNDTLETDLRHVNGQNLEKFSEINRFINRYYIFCRSSRLFDREFLLSRKFYPKTIYGSLHTNSSLVYKLGLGIQT